MGFCSGIASCLGSSYVLPKERKKERESRGGLSVWERDCGCLALMVSFTWTWEDMEMGMEIEMEMGLIWLGGGMR